MEKGCVRKHWVPRGPSARKKGRNVVKARPLPNNRRADHMWVRVSSIFEFQVGNSNLDNCIKLWLLIKKGL